MYFTSFLTWNIFYNRKGAGEAELLIAGRVFVLFLVVISIIWDVLNVPCSS